MRDNLHDMSKLFSCESKKNVIDRSSAEFSKRVVKVKGEALGASSLTIYMYLDNELDQYVKSQI